MRRASNCPDCKEDERYIVFCPKHQAEDDVISARWAYDRAHPVVPHTVTYYGQARPVDNSDLL